MLGSENFADGYTQFTVLGAGLGLKRVLGQLRHHWPWQGAAEAVLESTNAYSPFPPLPPWDTHDVQRANAWHSRHLQPSGE